MAGVTDVKRKVCCEPHNVELVTLMQTPSRTDGGIPLRQQCCLTVIAAMHHAPLQTPLDDDNDSAVSDPTPARPPRYFSTNEVELDEFPPQAEVQTYISA